RHAGGGLANLLNGRQQEADEDGDDGDHHQQLDQRKPISTSGADIPAEFRHGRTTPPRKGAKGPNQDPTRRKRRGSAFFGQLRPETPSHGLSQVQQYPGRPASNGLGTVRATFSLEYYLCIVDMLSLQLFSHRQRRDFLWRRLFFRWEGTIE